MKNEGDEGGFWYNVLSILFVLMVILILSIIMPTREYSSSDLPLTPPESLYTPRNR